MTKDLHYYPVEATNGRIIFIFKLAAGYLRNAKQADDIATKAESTLKAGDYRPDIVIMEGEPGANPKLFGSHSCVTYIRSILPSLAGPVWRPAILD